MLFYLVSYSWVFALGRTGYDNRCFDAEVREALDFIAYSMPKWCESLPDLETEAVDVKSVK